MGIFQTAQQEVRNAITEALQALTASQALPAAEMPQYAVEAPADSKNGDFSANIAMASAKALRMQPRKIAELIAAEIPTDGIFEKVEAAGPGFLNFYLGRSFYAGVIEEILHDGKTYGRSNVGQGKKVVVEFVSANPTGPMHMGNARGGALGDCLAAVLDACGYEVCREFYVNDAGNQVNLLGTSLEVRYLQIFKGEDAVPMPEDAYHGEDVKNHAANYAAEYGDKLLNSESDERREALVEYALPKNVAALKSDLEKYRITYDVWFKESTLHNSGAVDRVIELLKEKGCTYEQDGALWFKAEQYGADKDFVLVRANGVPTYVVPDIAYHYNKLVTRGFDKAIDILGTDHHGYVPRIKATVAALGVDPSRLDVILMQLVNLTRNGEVVRMSKRTGNSITLSDLLDEVPIDAARFFFNLRTPESQMEFDLGLAAEQSSQNPVYYTQYAHARICSILKNLAAEGIHMRPATTEELFLLSTEEERALIMMLANLPRVIEDAARTYDPAKVTRYAIDLATAFHRFYTVCHVKGSEEGLMQARLNLCACVKTALYNVLTMFKITTPETM